MKKRINTAISGFSLIEVIITIVVVAIVGTMLFTYFGTSITRSSDPIFRLNAATRLNAVLERISADYDHSISPGGSLTSFQNDIGAENSDQDNGYGRYRVIHNRFITFDTTVVPAAEINFTGNPSEAEYLKVTIGMRSVDPDRTNETLTTLFVKKEGEGEE